MYEQLSFFKTEKKTKLIEIRNAMSYRSRVIKELNEYKMFI